MAVLDCTQLSVSRGKKFPAGHLEKLPRTGHVAQTRQAKEQIARADCEAAVGFRILFLHEDNFRGSRASMPE